MRFLQRWRLTPRMRQSLRLSLLCAALIEALSLLGGLDTLRFRALDALFWARGPRAIATPITLIVADDATVAQVGRWPLPRSYYADAVRHLQRERARTIAFDILFSTPSYSPDDDAQFVHACNLAQRVVQAVAFQGLYKRNATRFDAALPVNEANDSPLQFARFNVTDHGAAGPQATGNTAPLRDLRSSAPLMGYINVYPELDGVLRHVSHLIRYRQQVYPSLSLATAAHFLGLKPQDIVAERNQVRLGNRVIPLDSDGEAWINWAGGYLAFPTYTLKQLLDGQVRPEAIKDRIILIGTTATGAYEQRVTPFSSGQPAIEAQANAINDILTNRPLREASPWLQLGLVFGFSILVGALTSPRRALGGTVWMLGAGLLLWRMAVWALSQYDMILPVAEPYLAGAMTFAMTAALNYRQEWEANWRADAAVATLARGGAVMASGRDRGRLQAEIRQTAQDALQARQVFLVLHEPTPKGTPQDALLSEVAQHVAGARHTVLWPAAADPQFPRYGANGQDSPSPTQRVLQRWRRGGTKSKTGDRAESLSSIVPLANGQHTSQHNAALNPLLKQLCLELEAHDTAGLLHRSGRHGTPTVVAAPLPRSKGELDQVAAGERRFSGALVAVGRRDGHFFTARDATLLETLAEQAGLALENLEYYEILRRRVELANRDLRDAYQLLAEQTAKLFAAVESIDDALIVSDENDSAMFVNGATARVLPNAVLATGESVPAALNDYGLTELAQLFEAVKLRPGDATPERAEMAYGTGEDETPRILTAQLTPLVSDDGHALGAMLVVADVTAQRELDKMKSDFIGFVAHELRNPLTSILGYASLLQTASDKISPQQSSEMTEVIMRHCRRLDRMVSELLDVSRLQAGRPVTLRREFINVAELCQRVLNDQKANLNYSQKIALEFECEECPLIAHLDPDRMEQIVINLVSNAIKYSPQGGTVTLSLRQSETELVLAVTDMGMGMSEEQLAQLFQRFYRTPTAIASGIKGTGLGLYLVKQLVEAHDGCIEVASVVGQGTTFTITLPVPANKAA